jgi:hypothetical protein
MTAAGPQQPDLTHERAQVMAYIAGSPMSASPAVRAATPLGPLPPALEAKLAARSVSTASSAGVRRRIVLPSGLLAAVDAVGVGVAAVSGHVLLAIVAAVLFVPLAALAIAGARFGNDPMRLTSADRRALSAASRWQSTQSWTGPVAHSRERGLVIAAARAAERIAASPAWRTGYLDEQRVRLDLAFELEQIDDQAHRIATASLGVGAVGPGTAPAVEAAWDAALNRVAALTAYANRLDGYEQRRREELARQGDPVRDSDLLAGSVRDEIAFDQLAALTIYLSASREDL